MTPGTIPTFKAKVADSGGGTTPPASQQITVTRNIATGNDDGYLATSGTNRTGYSAFMGNSGGYRNDAYFRFINVTVPQGAVINSAQLRVHPTVLYNSSGSNKYGVFGAIASNNAGVPTSMSEALTVASTLVVDLSQGVPTQIDLTSVLQEIVSRSGWANGNAICIKGVGNAAGAASGAEFVVFESASGQFANAGPRLTITYTP